MLTVYYSIHYTARHIFINGILKWISWFNCIVSLANFIIPGEFPNTDSIVLLSRFINVQLTKNNNKKRTASDFKSGSESMNENFRVIYVSSSLRWFMWLLNTVQAHPKKKNCFGSLNYRRKLIFKKFILNEKFPLAAAV